MAIPWAYVCPKCRHLGSKHGLIPGAPTAGPHRCPCGCRIMQDEPPLIGLTRAEYLARKKAP